MDNDKRNTESRHRKKDKTVQRAEEAKNNNRNNGGSE